MKSGNSDITIGLQIFAMRCQFPQLKYRRSRNQRPTWVGSLQPTDQSPQYKVKVVYAYPSEPKTWILAPSIACNAPHRYSDKSLCLYYYKDRSWNSRMLIAKTIIPWTAEWLGLYEIWCLTGMWYGDEAPHTGEK
jgi:hypothetical protein